MSPSLDLTLLEKVRHHASGKITARCPACAESGGDRTGNHLVIFPDGRFACVAHAGDANHRQRIFALAGIQSEPHPEQRRKWLAQRTDEQRQREASKHLVATARKHRQRLVERFAFEPADVWDDSPQRIDSDLVASCPRHFLATLFPPDAVVWTGEVHHSGKPVHADRWKPCADWLSSDGPIGPMTTPAIWQPGIHSRTGRNVTSAPFTVLDFDGFDGTSPRTEEELRVHLHASLALIRWLRESLHWQLAAILHTGGKSLHAWLHNPGPEALASLRGASAPLGIDAGLIGRPEHPCRLPGQRHSKTGGVSRVMWLQSP